MLLTKKTVVLILLLSLISLFPSVVTRYDASWNVERSSYATTTAKVVWVPDDHARIQWAINNVSDGDTVRVRAGTYYESVIVNRMVSLIGENRDTTIIDGNGKDTLFYVMADNVVINGFTVQHGHSGIWLWHSKNTTISHNNVNNNAYGIRMDHSSDSSIVGNRINDNQWFGIAIDHSGNSILRDNKLVGTRYNFRVDGEKLSDFVHDIDTSNTINDKPMHYLLNQHGLTIDSSTFSEIGYIAIINSTNISVKDLDLSYNGQGILLAYAENSLIQNLAATRNWNGIKIVSSLNITVGQNNANNNFDYGIKLVNSLNSVITENNAMNNNWAGVGIFGSQNCTISENNAIDNYYGFHIVYSSSLNVYRNKASRRTGGYSIVLYYSNYSLIYHNNFVNNFIYKYVKSTNRWDNGLEGNYWLNYDGDDSDQDGIGDTPYVLEEGNQDNHPLMGKFSVFNVTSGHSITLISNSTISNLQFDQENRIVGISATGPNGTLGFCRMRIPTALVDGVYKILVNNREPLMLKELPNSTGLYKYLYVTYTHSPQEKSTPDPFLITGLSLASASILGILIILVLRRKADGETQQVEPETSTESLTAR